MEEHLKTNRVIYFILICFICFLTVYHAPVRYTDADSWGELLVSQSLLEFGTIKLDYYKQSNISQPYALIEQNGHRYYNYPLGTSICSVPFVWLANLRGETMLSPESDHKLQVLLASITVVLAFMLVFGICRCYFNYTYSFLLSSTFIFGSSIASTMGVALWSMNLTTVFILAALYLIVRDASCKKPFNPCLLGLFLFMAYLCRPTAAIFVSGVLLYLLIRKRSTFILVAITSAMLFAGFVMFSYIEFHQLLPDYYLRPGYNSLENTFFRGMLGSLLSPARGLFVYQPYLLLTVIGAIVLIKSLYRSPLFWMSIVCFVLHLFAISRWPCWYGGYSFGSRLLTDSLPVLILLSCLVWNNILLRWKPAIGVFIPFAIISIFINTQQGLYNPYTAYWNPAINDNIYMFDWRHPQFMASPKLISSLKNLVKLNGLPSIKIGEVVSSEGNNAVLDNWQYQEKSGDIAWRWAGERTASIVFKLEPFKPEQEKKLMLEVVGATYKAQPVDILLNNVKLGVISNASQSVVSFPVPDWSLVKTGVENINTIQFVQVNPVLMDLDVDRNIFARFSSIRLYLAEP